MRPASQCIDQVKQGVSSPDVCTEDTVNQLRNLLFPYAESENPNQHGRSKLQRKKTPRATAPAAVGSEKLLPKVKRNPPQKKSVAVTASTETEQPLSTNRQRALAVHVVNAVLEALSGTSTPSPHIEKPPIGTQPRGKTSRARVLQEVSPNKDALAANGTKRLQVATTAHQRKQTSLELLSQCGAMAFDFVTLPTASASDTTVKSLLQSFKALSAFIGKLLTLKMRSLAGEQLAMMKDRLQTIVSCAHPTPQSDSTSNGTHAVPFDRTRSQISSDLLQALKAERRIEDFALLSAFASYYVLVFRFFAEEPQSVQSATLLTLLQSPSTLAPLPLLESLLLSKETEDGARQQLRAVARSLLNVASSNPSHTGEDAPLMALAADKLRIRTIALKLQCMLHNLDTSSTTTPLDVWRQFASYLSSYARTRNPHASGIIKHVIARECYDLLFAQLRANPIVGVENQSVAWEMLSRLCVDENSLQEAQEWTALLLTEASKSSRHTMKHFAWRSRMVVIASRRLETVQQRRDFEARVQQLKQLHDVDTTVSLDDFNLVVREMNQLQRAFRTARDLLDGTPDNKSSSERLCLDVLRLTARLLTRFGASVTRSGAEEEPLTSSPNHPVVLVDLCNQMVASIISSCSRPSGANPVSWELMHGALQDCILLAQTVKSLRCGAVDSSESGDRLYIRISEAYWSYYSSITDREDASLAQDGLHALQASCEVAGKASSAAQLYACLPAKLYKLGRCFQKLALCSEAIETLESCVQTILQSNMIADATDMISVMSLRDIQSMKSCKVLGCVLKALVEVRFDSPKRLNTHGFFDDAQLPSDLRGLLLEWQLDLLTNTPTLAQRSQQVRECIVDTLLEVYHLPAYPLRRCRVLVKILKALDEGGDHQRLSTHGLSVLDHLRDCGSEEQDLGNDQNLSAFRKYMSTSLEAALALYTADNPVSRLSSAVTIWDSLVSSEGGPETLRQRVDDLEAWLAQLQLVSDFCDAHGSDSLRTRVLELLATVSSAMGSVSPQQAASSHMALAMHYLRLNLPEHCGVSLKKARDATKCIDNSLLLALRLQTVELEYHHMLGNTEKSLHVEQSVKKSIRELLAGQNAASTIAKLEQTVTLADAYMACSRMAMVHEVPYTALCLSKEATLILQQAWKSLESRSALKKEPKQPSVEEVTIDLVENDLSNAQLPTANGSASAIKRYYGPAFWTLARHLFHGLLQQSCYAKYFGLAKEASTAAEQAHKLAQDMGAKPLAAEALVDLADSTCRSGDDERGQSLFGQAKGLYEGAEHDQHLAIYHEYFGYSHHLQRRWAAEIAAYDQADQIVREVSSVKPASSTKSISNAQNKLEQAMQTLTLTSKAESHAVPRKTRVPNAPRKARSTTKEKTAKETTRQKQECEPVLEDFVANQEAVTRLIVRRADSLSAQRKYDEAKCALQRLDPSKGSPEAQAQAYCSLAWQSLYNALQSMQTDVSFTMLLESTMANPVLTHPRRRSASNSSKKALAVSPVKKGGASVETPKLSVPLVLEALGYMDSVRQLASSPLSNWTLSRTASVTALSSLIVSFVQGRSTQQPIHPSSIAYNLEMLRNVSAYREQDLVDAKNAVRGHIANPAVLQPTKSDLRNRVSAASAFQSDLVDVIPEDWTAVSMTLANDQEHLIVTRYRTRRTPFVVRVPLTRSNAEELEEDSFTFADAKSEMMDIIQSSDATVHRSKDNTIDMGSKAAQKEWWSEREALDQRLRDLLTNIENMWLGGFRGMLSRHFPMTNLLARFRQTFHNILDKQLPSRQRLKKGSQAPGLGLDTHVYELFLELGDPTDQEEALLDLLYFVVDILQFNGEANAYDEIDFDAMTVEVTDALKSYHDAAQQEDGQKDAKHIILILDKQLHGFPWESLPCLKDQSTSRLPSLVDLGDRIRQMQRQHQHISNPTAASGSGIRISRHRGTSILNPAGDLAKTSARFTGPLSTLSSPAHPDRWKTISGRAPTSEEFSAALTSDPASDPSLLLYFGHGSGAQYIRHKTIARLRPHCNAALLFGCSSAALTPMGEFEPHGTPKTYLVAGAPAVLGALWDVTDGDCDAFAQGTLRRWGLVDGKAFDSVKDKGRKRKAAETRGTGAATDTAASLSLAVARSRDDCYLRYLNGAAMVVYGVPCYLGD